MIGTCALCHKNTDLQNSHLIPKWAYRRICKIDQADSKIPIHIADGNAAFSNRQTTKHLLCADCEQRFSNSEGYLARLTALDNGRIELFRRVMRLDTPRSVLASLHHAEDADHLTYFAASVIWRGSVMTSGCELGPYVDKFRRYLLCETQFPREAVISVGLLEQSPNSNADPRGWISTPASTKAGTMWLHGFLLAGLAFRCWVGKEIPKKWHNVSLAGPNSTKYVSILKPEECTDFLAAAEMVKMAKPRGKLAKS